MRNGSIPRKTIWQLAAMLLATALLTSCIWLARAPPPPAAKDETDIKLDDEGVKLGDDFHPIFPTPATLTANQFRAASWNLHLLTDNTMNDATTIGPGGTQRNRGEPVFAILGDFEIDVRIFAQGISCQRKMKRARRAKMHPPTSDESPFFAVASRQIPSK